MKKSADIERRRFRVGSSTAAKRGQELLKLRWHIRQSRWGHLSHISDSYVFRVVAAQVTVQGIFYRFRPGCVMQRRHCASND
jgi:hypothetical protein